VTPPSLLTGPAPALFLPARESSSGPEVSLLGPTLSIAWVKLGVVLPIVAVAVGAAPRAEHRHRERTRLADATAPAPAGRARLATIRTGITHIGITCTETAAVAEERLRLVGGSGHQHRRSPSPT
jgi:hypothetical protein